MFLFPEYEKMVWGVDFVLIFPNLLHFLLLVLLVLKLSST